MVMCDDGVDKVGGCKCEEERKEKRRGICQVDQILLNNTMGLDWLLLRETRRSCEHSGRNVVRVVTEQVRRSTSSRAGVLVPSVDMLTSRRHHPSCPKYLEGTYLPTPGRYPPKYPREVRYSATTSASAAASSSQVQPEDGEKALLDGRQR